MALHPAQLAGGGGGAPPAQAPQVQVAPGATPEGGDIQGVIQLLEGAVQQAVDEEGYVDLEALAQVWPQVAEQAGVNVPFATVLQLIQQQPELIVEIVQKLQLRGIIIDGRQVGAEELQQMSQGGDQGAPPAQAVQGGGGGTKCRVREYQI